jgi:hypothetical protein
MEKPTLFGVMKERRLPSDPSVFHSLQYPEGPPALKISNLDSGCMTERTKLFKKKKKR